MVPNEIENQVVALRTLGEVFLRVVYDVIGADGSNEIDISRAAHARDFSPKCLCYLHRECSDASGRAVHQNFLSGLNLSLVTKTLQRGNRRNRHSGRLLEGHIGWLAYDSSIGQHTNVFRKGSIPPTENFIASLEARDTFANGFNCAGIIDT